MSERGERERKITYLSDKECLPRGEGWIKGWREYAVPSVWERTGRAVMGDQWHGARKELHQA